LIVFNLSCAADHRFEGWFASGEDFDAQRGRGLLSCPMCGSADVSKQLSAPRLNLHAQPEKRAERHTHAGDAAAAKAEAPQQPVAMLSAQQQELLRELVRQVVQNTEDVGDRFAEEARKMHYGEAEERGIRGHATPEQTEALLDEGIAVMPLPIPAALKETLQ